MIYLKAFQALLPPEVNYHLDVGSGPAFRFKEFVNAKNTLYNDVDGTISKLSQPCFFGNALLLSTFLKEKMFDLITCFDVIEHLKKEDGYQLIKDLESLCCGELIFFTPLGEIGIGQSPIKYHVHLSGWTPEDFIKLGYKCWVFPNFHKTLHYGAFFAIKSNQEIKYPSLEKEDEMFKGEYWLK
jgi:hypothetical protein